MFKILVENSDKIVMTTGSTLVVRATSLLYAYSRVCSGNFVFFAQVHSPRVDRGTEPRPGALLYILICTVRVHKNMSRGFFLWGAVFHHGLSF